MGKLKMKTYAVITILYKNKKHKSILLDIEDDKTNIELVTLISETGTSKLAMFKLPISETKFMIFSREQLDECLFEIEIISNINDNENTEGIILLKS